MAQLVRVDIADRQAGLAQRLFRPALVAAARLQPTARTRRPRSAAKARPAGRVVVDAKTLSRSRTATSATLGDIDTDHQTLFSHLFHPFLAVRACPLQLFGFKKKGGRAPAHSRYRHLRDTGSRPPPRTGGDRLPSVAPTQSLIRYTQGTGDVRLPHSRIEANGRCTRA